jgi:putative transposase
LGYAVLYFCERVLPGGCCPHDLPPWQTVYYYLRRWHEEGVRQHVYHALVLADRERCGREASPSAAIRNSQSVRTADQKGAKRL